MVKTVILDGARTPFGRLGGGLSSVTASELGGIAIKGALTKAKIAPEAVDEVIMGTVLTAGQGQIPSRQAATKGGIPFHVPTETINKVCASGMRAVTLADQLIRLGEIDVAVAGGMESMSNAPYIMKSARFGSKMGDVTMKDSMVYDGLTDAFSEGETHMGVFGDETASKFNLSREAQDEWSYRSHERALQAIEDGTFAEEIVPVTITHRKGETVVQHDEAPRKDTTLEKLATLRPAFVKGGTVTAGNAPGVNDGAAALVVASDTYATEHQFKPLATILGHVGFAAEPKDFPETPGHAILQLLEQQQLTVEDIDLFEINEAFALVSLVSADIAAIPHDKINVNGGAVALGHPIGASGARIILTLAYALKKRGGGKGIAAICSGGGQGDAILIEVPKQ